MTMPKPMRSMKTMRKIVKIALRMGRLKGVKELV